MKPKLRIILSLIMIVCLLVLMTGCSVLGVDPNTAGSDILEEAADPLTDDPLGGLLGNRTETVEIIMLLTILSVLPSILLMMTCFTRVVIVLSMIRNAMGTQNTPPTQVIIGLSLIITFFIMSPVINEIKTTAYTPYIENRITQKEALETGMKPLRNFMMRQTHKNDFDLFVSMANRNVPEEEWVTDPELVPNSVVMAAFMTSEVKRAFEIGFFLYLPFIVIDMIVASVLMSMGMMMLPPVAISLPFKILLFILVDGWMLTIQSLITSFG